MCICGTNKRGPYIDPLVYGRLQSGQLHLSAIESGFISCKIRADPEIAASAIAGVTAQSAAQTIALTSVIVRDPTIASHVLYATGSISIPVVAEKTYLLRINIDRSCHTILHLPVFAWIRSYMCTTSTAAHQFRWPVCTLYGRLVRMDNVDCLYRWSTWHVRARARAYHPNPG